MEEHDGYRRLVIGAIVTGKWVKGKFLMRKENTATSTNRHLAGFSVLGCIEGRSSLPTFFILGQAAVAPVNNSRLKLRVRSSW